MKVDVENTEVYKTMPGIKATDAEWMRWADKVMSRYGQSLGKQVFLGAWIKRGGQAANTIAFRKHLKDRYGLEVDESVWNKVADIGGGIADSIGKVLRVGKVVLIGASIFAGVVIIGMGISLMRNPSKLVR